jgi:two-component system, OmpR family, sensor histidine kinase KdpD
MRSSLFTISPKRIARSLLAVAMVFALTAVMLLIGSKMLGEGVIALLYLVPIGWCTVRWGQIAGVSAALTAALCFDFFFIPPYETFTMGSVEGWLLWLLFSAVSFLVVGRIQTILGDWQNRERKATFLYEMVAAMANLQSRQGIARVVADQIQQKYLAELVGVHLNGRGSLPDVREIAANNPSGTLTAHGKPDRTLPIVSGPVLIGDIAIWKGLLPLPSDEDPMVQTLLRQTAAALDRAQVSEENAQLPAQTRQDNLSV